MTTAPLAELALAELRRVDDLLDRRPLDLSDAERVDLMLGRALIYATLAVADEVAGLVTSLEVALTAPTMTIETAGRPDE